MKKLLPIFFCVGAIILNACNSQTQSNNQQTKIEFNKVNPSTEDITENSKTDKKQKKWEVKGILKEVRESKYYDQYFESYYLTIITEGKEIVVQYYRPINDIQLLIGNEIVLYYKTEQYCNLESFELWDVNLPPANEKKGQKVGLGIYYTDLSIEEAQGGTTDTPNYYSVKLDNGLEASSEDFLTINDVANQGKKVRAYYTVGWNEVIDTIKTVKSIDALKEIQIDKIREVFKTTNTAISNKEYKLDTIKKDLMGGFLILERAYDDEELKYAKLINGSDHGSDIQHFYFNEGKIIFLFEEDSYWVGQSDELKERRLYYFDNKLIKAIGRHHKGTGGYNTVKKQLSKLPQNAIETEHTEVGNTAYNINNMTINNIEKNYNNL